MSSVFNLALSPFAYALGLAYSRPWLSVIVSGVAGLIALALHHEIWMGLLISFGAYMLMWMDEAEHPVEAVAPDAAE
ncbi:hypothetical protein [Roseomonas sp. AR75]|uniref:hypothetical protein n=1 Tax=Roseomonas sp. AR75 TaxID=2562311 RepID=UPI0010C0ADDA|nr:hypothetical protein [Roseomonas sp. AR75]